MHVKGERASRCYSPLKYTRFGLWTYKSNITAGKKDPAGVKRSKGWVMLEGLSSPRRQTCPVPGWDETLLLFNRTWPMGFKSVAIDWGPRKWKKRKLEQKWQRNPSATPNPSSWVIALSATSSLLIHAHCTPFLYVKVKKVDTFPGSSRPLGRYFSSGGGGRGDKCPPNHWPCRSYWW